MESTPLSVERIAIDKISILNPRGRSRRAHRVIIENIDAVGLKRPITVSRRRMPDGSERYDLVCGQGRIEAFQALGERFIPAIVLERPEEECLVMSLVENVARPQHRGIDLMREVGALRGRGYTEAQVAEKIGVTTSWVKMITTLLEKGEERLIAAVESGLMPLTLAMTIAKSDDAGVQQLLADAYTDGKIKGRNLEVVRRLLERRHRRGGLGPQRFGRGNTRSRTSPEQLVQLFRKEADRQRLIAKKADYVQSRLLFIVQALKELRREGDFTALLQAEKLDTLPRALDARFSGGPA